MMRKLIATAAVAGSLAFGAVGLVGSSGVAGAASPSTATTPGTATPATHASRCAQAETLAKWIQAGEAKAAVWLPKAQARQSAATAAGNTTVATRIAHRISRVQKLETKGNTLLAKIAAKCGTATGTSTS
jgi:hypothetical protein